MPARAVAAVLVAAASITTAVLIHRTLSYCSYGGGPPPPCSRPADYPLDLRLGIAAGGLLIAALILTLRRQSRRRP